MSFWQKDPVHPTRNLWISDRMGRWQLVKTDDGWMLQGTDLDGNRHRVWYPHHRVQQVQAKAQAHIQEAHRV